MTGKKSHGRKLSLLSLGLAFLVNACSSSGDRSPEDTTTDSNTVDTPMEVSPAYKECAAEHRDRLGHTLKAEDAIRDNCPSYLQHKKPLR